MKLAEIVDRVSIDPRKLTHYALDPESPHGRHKAILFERILGFTKENCAGLIHQLETRTLQSETAFHSEDEFGRRYTADVPVEGTKGQEAVVRTGWLVPAGTREAHLVTLYLKR